MTNINHNSSNLRHCLGQNSEKLMARSVYFADGGGPEKPTTPEAIPPKPTIDVNHPDFDNIAFAEEKNSEFSGTLDYSIRDAISKVPELKDKTKEIDQLKTEFGAGLSEKVMLFKDDIAASIEKQSPALFAEKATLTADKANDWFQNVLINLKCNKVGLVYDKTDDTTKFKFYGEKGEIKFKSSDIKIQYVPKGLSDSAETIADTSEVSKTFKVSKKEKLTKNYSIDHVALIEKNLSRKPVDGDRVVIKRGSAELKGAFNKEKNLFIGEDGKQLWFIGDYPAKDKNPAYSGDSVTFYPKTKEKVGPVNEIELDGKKFVVLRQVETKLDYKKIAKTILSEVPPAAGGPDEVEKYKICNAVADFQESIIKTGISVPEYAALLKAAHEKVGKTALLPIVMPHTDTERKMAIRSKKETAEAEAHEAEVSKKATDTTLSYIKSGLDVSRNARSPKEQAEMTKYMSVCEAKLARETDPKKRLAIIQDLLDELDNFFVEAGFTRKISKNLESVMDAGKDSVAWRELWDKENPTVNKTMTIINAHPDVFGKISINKVRNIVYDLIRAGNSSSFDSGDIIKNFGIKLPVVSKEYDEVLGLAAITTDATDPELKEKQEKCRRYVGAIEGLSKALSELDPSQSKEKFAGGKKHEKLDEKAETGAKNLKKLVDLLNVDTSTPIEKEKDDYYVCTIEKGGKQLTLRLINSWDRSIISVDDTQTGKRLWSTVDMYGFDAPDYVDKINELLLATAKSKKAEKSGEELPELALPGKPEYFSLRSLETLNQEVPGVPVKELLDTQSKKEPSWGNKLIGNRNTLVNNLTNKTKDLLQAMGVLEDATFVETPTNLNNIKGNDQALINVRYRGKDFTLSINNATIGWGVRLKPGFNNDKAFTGDTAYTTAGGMDTSDAVIGINKVLTTYGSSVESMSIETTHERLAILSTTTASFNKLISEHTRDTKSPVDMTLNDKQMMEAIFRAYSFDELKALNCISKVKDNPKAYVITDLPPIFKNIKFNQAALDLVHAIKFTSNNTSKFSEAARESANTQIKYENRLKKLFAYGLTAIDQKGKKINMGDVDSGGVTIQSSDEYFNKVAGNAAYNDFYSEVKTRNEKGVEEIDVKKTNEKLTDLYQKGLVRLKLLAKSDKGYAELNKLITDDLRSKKIDINKDLTDIDKKVIRLGYLQDVEGKEIEQTKKLETMKAKLIENILKLFPDKIQDPKYPDQSVSKNQAANSLETLPISILLSYSHNKDGSNTVGVFLPITLDVFGSDYAKIVLIPGANTSDGLKFAVGASFTNKDPNDKEQRWILMGGVSMGMGTNFSEASFGAALSAGVDYKIIRADEIDNYNHYLGLKAGVGLDITEGKFGFNAGAAYTWEIDAKQKYKNSLKEHFTKEGVQSYIDELADIYTNKKSNPAAIEAFATKLKADKNMADKLELKSDTPTEEVLANFELYVATLMNKFNEEFDLPLIVGGQFGFGVVDGAIIATSMATGNVPLLVGGVAAWGIQVMASLKFNVGSRMVIERKQKTSEAEMGAYGEKEKQDQFDKLFADEKAFPKSKAASEIYLSGKNTLDKGGKKKTSMEIVSSSAELPADNIGKKLAEFNKSLTAKGIDMMLKKDKDDRIELLLLDSKVAANEKILISPDLAVTEGGKIFLKNPNDLSFLYFNKQTRKYPLETSHGATMESVITISDNRFYKGNTFPTELSITRFADAKDTPIINGKSGTAEKFVDNSIDYVGLKESTVKMKDALDKSGIESEPVRPNIKEIAKKIYAFKSKEGETFISLTSEKAKAGIENPDYLSEKLYAFYDKYAVKQKPALDLFNASEKALLTLELSTLRYTTLMAGAPNAFERARRFRERLEWAKEAIRPYFEKRISDLVAEKKLKITPPDTEKSRAKKLVDKSIADLQYLDTSMPTSKLKEGTSVAVAIGNGGKGLHQMLDGTKDKLAPGEVDKYGYIIGKDYTEALRTGTPADDHDIALILMGQLSTLPSETADLKGFMDSNLARKLASNAGLAFILGKAEYDKVVAFYQSGTGDAAGLKKFIDIVKEIRTAEQTGKDLVSIKGDKGINFLIKVSSKIQTGVFSKCGNYSAAISEEIAIIPPSKEDAMVLLATGSDAKTSLSTSAYKQFISAMGGVVGSVQFDKSPAASGGGGKPTPGNDKTVGQTPTGPDAPILVVGPPQPPDAAIGDIKNAP